MTIDVTHTARATPGRGGSWFSRIGVEGSLPAVGVVIGIVLIATPFLVTLIRSLLVWDGDAPGLSLGNFLRLFNDARFYTAITNTFIASAFTTVFSTIMGFVLAWIVCRTDMPGRKWFETANLIPFFLSPYVGAVSWIYLAAPNSGMIQKALNEYLGISVAWMDIYSLPGVIWVLSIFYTPYVYLFIIAPLRQMDASLEDAARVHGASFLYTVRRITLPLLAPALLSGALVVFVTSAGLFDVPLALATPRGIRMMPTEIFAAVQYPADFGRASAFGVIVMCVTILLTLLQRNYIAKRRFDTISGKAYRLRLIPLRGVARVGALAIEVFYISCGVILPIGALILVSVSSFWTGSFRLRLFTFDNYEYVLFGLRLTREAITNSIILAVVGATLGVVISLMQSYYLNRGPRKGRGFIDAALALPLGIPGIVLALGFLLVALRTPLYSTLTIIGIAFIARFFPMSTRTISGLLIAINPELEQSARASGASWLQTMRYILLPLLRPAIIASWLLLFVIFIRELGATILLYAQGTETISVALILLSERSSGYVAALAVVQLCLLIFAIILMKITKTSIIQD